MGRSLASKNGNDCIQTPIDVARKIAEHFKPTGKILEPCCGEGNFLTVLGNLADTIDWCEILKGIDFLTFQGYYDWIITNPPYSKYRDFLNKSMQVADNIVFLQLINATFYKARLRDIRNNNFGIKEIWCIDTPKEFPQFGFQMGCVYYKRGHEGDIMFNGTGKKPSVRE